MSRHSSGRRGSNPRHSRWQHAVVDSLALVKMQFCTTKMERTALQFHRSEAKILCARSARIEVCSARQNNQAVAKETRPKARIHRSPCHRVACEFPRSDDGTAEEASLRRRP